MRWCGTARVLTLDVHCSGTTHQLQWSDGSVRMRQHPDADAELALVGLGSQEPPCLGRLRLWNDAVRDGGFLEDWVIENNLSEAYLSWLGMALERMRLEGFQEFLRGLPMARAARMGQFVHTFPLPWLDRAAAEVGHAIDSQLGVVCSDATRLIQEATSVRVRRAFVNAVGSSELSLGAAALVKLDIRVDQASRTSIVGSLASSASAAVHIDVAPSWLHTTWAKGASVIDGRLILELIVDDKDEVSTTLTATASTVAWNSGRAHLEVRAVGFNGTVWSLGELLEHPGM